MSGGAQTPREGSGDRPSDAPTLRAPDGGELTPDDDAVGLETRRLRAAIGARLFGETPAVVPTKIGRHVLLEPLGAGGMGVVYAAYDPQLDRKVAIKVLHPTAGASDHASDRLLQEAQAMAKLNHPHVIAVHDAGIDAGQVYLAMEYIDGGTLASWCAAHPPTDRRRFEAVLALLEQAAQGLQAAHEAGLVHRDLKPLNMLIDGRGRLRVADFGLARVDSREPESTGDSDELVARDPEVATAGRGIVGTPAYMAPEQFEGTVGSASDQWSWCATAWEAAYGRRPFEGGSVVATFELRRRGPPEPPVGRPEVPAWFHRVLARGLDPRPARRYPSMAALLRDLQRRRARPRRAATVVGVSVLAAAAIWGWASRPEPAPRASPCDGLPAVAAGTFDPEVADRIAASLRDRPGASASTVADRVVGRLQRYRDGWVAGAQRACRRLDAEVGLDPAADPLSHPSASMRCYADARLGLEIMVEEQLGIDSANAAITMLDALPSLARCERGTGMLPPTTAAERDASRLVARAMIVSGRRDHAQARRLLDQAHDALGETPSPTVRARIAYVRGVLAHRRGDHGPARARAREALASVDGRGDGELVTKSWVLVADIARAEGRFDDAHFALDRAAWFVRDAGSPSWRQAEVDRARAAIWYEVGDEEKALHHGEAALAAYARLYGRDSRNYARMLQNHVPVLWALGRFDEARDAAAQVLRVYEDSYGPRHPDTARAMSRQALLFGDLGEIDRAVQLYREAIDILRDHPDVDPRDKGVAYLGLIQTLSASRRVEQAREVAVEAEAAVRRWLGGEHELVRVLETARAGLELDAGNNLDAIARYEAIRSARDPSGQRLDDVNSYVTCVNLATAYARAGRHDDALAQVAECDAAADTFEPPTPMLIPGSQRYLGEVLQRAGRHDEARRRYVRAARALDENAKTDRERAEVHLGIAEIDVAQGHLEGLAGRLDIVRDVLAAHDDPKLDARLAEVAAALP